MVTGKTTKTTTTMKDDYKKMISTMTVTMMTTTTMTTTIQYARCACPGVGPFLTCLGRFLVNGSRLVVRR